MEAQLVGVSAPNRRRFVQAVAAAGVTGSLARPARAATATASGFPIVGTSSESWEAAARNAVETGARQVRGLARAHVLSQDVTIEDGTITSFDVQLIAFT